MTISTGCIHAIGLLFCYDYVMKIIVGTKNHKKVTSAKKIFQDVLSPNRLTVESCDAQSLVPNAPHDEETYNGAMNRAKECMNKCSGNYYVGIESGLVERYGNLFEESWAVVLSDNGDSYIGYSSGLLIPHVITKRMRQGEKHDTIMEYYDRLFELPEDNRDTWSRYTGGNISRQLSLDEALRNAIIQLMPSDRNLYISPS